MRHRIFLVPLRPDLDPVAARRHWTEAHAPLFARTPGLRGYVQNRPEPGLDGWVCSETWFADADAERGAYASDFYVHEVTPDESRFLDRGAAWVALVRGDGPPVPELPGAYRALILGWAGGDPPSMPHVEIVALDRAGPAGGPPRLLSAWADDPAALTPALAEPGDVALLTRPAVIL
jgi:hypothetical protein